MLVRLERVDLQLLELIVESTMWQESGSVKYIRHGYQFTTVVSVTMYSEYKSLLQVQA